MMRNVDVPTLKKMIADNEDIFLLDVREIFEREQFNIGGEHVPLAGIMEYAPQIPQDKKVILYCEKGIRSGIAIQRLQQRYPQLQLYNLGGGIQAWKKDADS